MSQLLQETVFAVNSPLAYFHALLLFVGVLIVLKIFQQLVLSRLKTWSKRTTNDFDDVFIDILSHLKPPLYIVIALYVALESLILVAWLEQAVEILFILVIADAAIRSLSRLFDYAVQRYVKHESEEAAEAHAATTASMMKIFRVILVIILWIIVILFILSNFGVNVTSLIASLGVGGIAIALALQNVLSDLFASFSIFLDKPFQVGDFIQFGDDLGTVEKIGVRSTRIRTLLGEQLIVPNQDLTAAHIQNFKRMKRRREEMRIGVTYETPFEQIKKIPEMIKTIISEIDTCEFERSHFSSYGDSALMYETVYYITEPDYNVYMDIKQEINLKLFEVFQKEGIAFAYPTQTVHVQQKK